MLTFVGSLFVSPTHFLSILYALMGEVTWLQRGCCLTYCFGIGQALLQRSSTALVHPSGSLSEQTNAIFFLAFERFIFTDSSLSRYFFRVCGACCCGLHLRCWCCMFSQAGPRLRLASHVTFFDFGCFLRQCQRLYLPLGH